LAFLVQDGQTGYHVPSDSPEDLCDKLTAILDDPNQRRRMGQRAAEYAHLYSWDKIARQILEVYKELLQGKPEVFV
jgi:glycosyltransferase involved in cell wall biosynthesis